MKRGLLILTSSLLAATLPGRPTASAQSPADPHPAKARRVLRTTRVVEGHNDLLCHYFVAAERKGDFTDWYYEARGPTGSC